VRVHDRLLKLEARVDLALKRSSSDGGGGSAAAAAAAAAASAAKAEAAATQEELASMAATQSARDITWRVRDAVESTFAQGWEARRGVEGATTNSSRTAGGARAAAVAAPAAAATTPAAAANRTPPLPQPTTKRAKVVTVPVEFFVSCPHTAFGERVWVSGGGSAVGAAASAAASAALGGWKPERALRLRWGEGGRWHAACELEVEVVDSEEQQAEQQQQQQQQLAGVAFKALLRRDGAEDRGRWEQVERNRQLTVGVGGGGVLTVTASEGVRATVLPDGGGVRVEFEARF
jgi:hypothetical protein